MSLATLSNVSVQFGDQIILDRIDVTIPTDARIGVLGRNGAGKSTLLGLLTGRLTPDAGSVEIQRGLRVGMLDQHPSFEPGASVREVASSAFARLSDLRGQLDQVFEAMATADSDQLDHLMQRQAVLEGEIESAGGWDVDHMIDATLHGVGIEDDMFDRPAEKLSGGEKARLSLARLLLESPDLLLLDEPTNHLDIDGRQWLERFLVERFRGAVLVVSHDRWLLDAVCTRMIEVRRAQVEVYPTNYSGTLALREERRLTESRAWEKQQDHVRREEAYIRRYKAGQRAKQARGRASRLQRFIADSGLERPESEVVASMRLPVPPRCGEQVLAAEALQVRIGDRTLVADLDLEIRRGERIGIIGPNGAGKTTLIRALLGAHPLAGGRVEQGTGLQVGWFKQLQDHLDPECEVWEWIQRSLAEAHGGSASEQEARDLAGAFMFSGEDQDRLLGTLSGGERARVMLAGLFGGGHNLLILDEPSNHIDIPTAERLEAVLAEGGPYTGTLVLVSHDRALLESCCDRLIVFDGEGGVHTFDGPVSRWLERAEPRARVAESGPTRMAPARQPTDRLANRSLADLESTMAGLEERLGALAASIDDEAVWSDPEKLQEVVDEQKAVAEELAECEAAWLARAEDS